MCICVCCFLKASDQRGAFISTHVQKSHFPGVGKKKTDWSVKSDKGVSKITNRDPQNTRRPSLCFLPIFFGKCCFVWMWLFCLFFFSFYISNLYLPKLFLSFLLIKGTFWFSKYWSRKWKLMVLLKKITTYRDGKVGNNPISPSPIYSFSDGKGKEGKKGHVCAFYI